MRYSNEVEVVEIDVKGGYSSDFPETQKKISQIIEEYNKDGWEVQSITPLSSGYSDYDDSENQSYGYGYSYTSGLIILFRKKNDF